MNWTYLTSCELVQPAIRSCWEVLLNEEPDWVPTESPAALAGVMDDILAELWQVLRFSTMPGSVERRHPVSLSDWNPSNCELKPVLIFLGTGRRALQEIAQMAETTQMDLVASERAEERAELLTAFDIVAQREIHRVCGFCRHKETCALGDPYAGASKPGSAAPWRDRSRDRTRFAESPDLAAHVK